MVHLRDISDSHCSLRAFGLFEEIFTPCSRDILTDVHNEIILFQIIFKMMQYVIEYLNLNNNVIVTLETQISGPRLPLFFFQGPFV